MIKLDLPKDTYLIMCDPFHEGYDKAWKIFFKDCKFENYLQTIMYYEVKKYNKSFDLIDDCIGEVLLNLCKRIRGKEYAAKYDNMAPYVIKIIRYLIIDFERKHFRIKVPTISVDELRK